MSFVPSENPITHPERQDWVSLRPFRFWCQKVLPLVYDDSLSYYELLCKVVDYLNKTMEDVENMNTDVDNLYNNFQQFQEGTFKIYEELVDYVNTYFDELDIQEEINTKLDNMVTSGQLLTVIQPTIANEVTNWLSEHVTPTTPSIDTSLSITGAGADSKVVGDDFGNHYSTTGIPIKKEVALHEGNIYLRENVNPSNEWNSNSWLLTNINKLLTILNNNNDAFKKGSAFNFLNPDNYIYLDQYIENYYINYETGRGGVVNNWVTYFPIKIDGGFYYNTNINGTHITFFDENMNYISGVLVPISMEFLAPETAVYLSYSLNVSNNVNPYIVKSTKKAVQYYNPDVKTLSGTIELLLEHFLPIINIGKNLFFKQNLLSGISFHYTEGNRLWNNDGYSYCPTYIPCKPNTSYTVSDRGCLIGEYDINKKAILVQNITTFSAPMTFVTNENTRYLRCSVQNALIDTFQIEEGASSTSYEPFNISLKYQLAGEEQSELNILIVDQGGTGDYTTITDACNNAVDGDIIYIKNGTYRESLKLFPKRLHLVGEDRDKTILIYSGKNRPNPPLEIAKGSVCNMTIHADATGEQTSGVPLAYAVHIDNDNSLNEALYFDNVTFINDVHQVVGIGLRPNFTLTFNDCVFIAKNKTALYCHDWETSDTSADKTGQKMIVKNCCIVNDSFTNSTILLQSQELVDGGAEGTFINNTILNKSGGSLIYMFLWDGRSLTNDNFMGSSDWILTDDSSLNTLNLLNAVYFDNPKIIKEIAFLEESGYFNADGSISSASANSQEKYTQEYIPVVPSEKIQFNITYDNTDRAMWISYILYDSNKDIIGTRQLLANETLIGGLVYNGEISIPDDTYYIRFSYRTFGVGSRKMWRKGNVYDLILSLR